MNSTQFKKEFSNLKSFLIIEIGDYLLKNKAKQLDFTGNSLVFSNQNEQFSDVLSGINEDVIIIASMDDTYGVKYDEPTTNFLVSILEKLEKGEFNVAEEDGE